MYLEGTGECASERSNEVSGVMHVQADLLNSIRNVWSGEGEVLKSPGKTAILTWISD